MRTVIAVLALAALLPIIVRADITADDVLAADRAFNEARRAGRTQPIETFLDNATEVQSDGGVLDSASRDRPVVPYLAATVDGERVYDDIGVLFGTVTLPGSVAHYMRVWVSHEGKWRLLTSQLVPVIQGAVQPRIRVPAALPTDSESIDRTLVADAENARLIALRESDHRGYDHLLGQDYSGIDASGLSMTKESELQSDRSYQGRLVEQSVVDVFGPVAVVRGLEANVDRTGTPTGGAQFVRVWVRRGGQLELVAQVSTVAHAGPVKYLVR
jgi:hypothetical protein